MQHFTRFSAAFFVFAVVATTLVRGSIEHLPGVVGFALATVKYMGAGPWVLWLLPFVLYLGWKFPSRLIEAVMGFAATLLLVSGYTMFKATIPTLVPFWADPLFTSLDQMLHGGTDPWMLAHDLSHWIDTDGVAFTYSGLWGGFAFSFPAVLALCDLDGARKVRYLAAYALAWVVLGNFGATVFSSAGPIYADAVTGTDHFAPMLASLTELNFPGTSVDRIQQALWAEYVADSGAQLGGAGISAFPSMHVAIAAIIGLYVSERSWFFAPVGLTFVATIQFLSVYTGWHYAVDGYASILGVATFLVAMRYIQTKKT